MVDPNACWTAVENHQPTPTQPGPPDRTTPRTKQPGWYGFEAEERATVPTIPAPFDPDPLTNPPDDPDLTDLGRQWEAAGRADLVEQEYALRLKLGNRVNLIGNPYLSPQGACRPPLEDYYAAQRADLVGRVVREHAAAAERGAGPGPAGGGRGGGGGGGGGFVGGRGGGGGAGGPRWSVSPRSPRANSCLRGASCVVDRVPSSGILKHGGPKAAGANTVGFYLPDAHVTRQGSPHHMRPQQQQPVQAGGAAEDHPSVNISPRPHPHSSPSGAFSPMQRPRPDSPRQDHNQQQQQLTENPTVRASTAASGALAAAAQLQEPRRESDPPVDEQASEQEGEEDEEE